MRGRVLTAGAFMLLGWGALPGALLAQGGSWSVSPRVGYAWPGDLFRHEVTHRVEGPEMQVDLERLERLHVRAMRTLGGEVRYRITPRWAVGVDVEHGASTFEYRYESGANGALSEQQVRRSDAALTAFGVAVKRRAALPAGISADVGIGARLDRFTLDKSGEPCPPSGGIAICGITGPWERTYSIPSLASGIEFRRQLTRRFGVDVGSAFSVGRADTRSFQRSSILDPDPFKAPSTTWVPHRRMFVGVVLQL